MPSAELNQGMNLYEYVKNEPLNLWDPLGLGGAGGNNNQHGVMPPGYQPLSVPQQICGAAAIGVGVVASPFVLAAAVANPVAVTEIAEGLASPGPATGSLLAATTSAGSMLYNWYSGDGPAPGPAPGPTPQPSSCPKPTPCPSH